MKKKKRKVIFLARSALFWQQPVLLSDLEICGGSHILPPNMEEARSFLSMLYWHLRLDSHSS